MCCAVIPVAFQVHSIPDISAYNFSAKAGNFVVLVWCHPTSARTLLPGCVRDFGAILFMIINAENGSLPSTCNRSQLMSLWPCGS